MSRATSIDKPVIIENKPLDKSEDAIAVVVAKCNSVNVGIPVVSPKNVDYLALLGATPTFNLKNSTLYTMDTEGVSTYKFTSGEEDLAMGIAFNMNGERVAVPIYTIPQNDLDVCTITFDEPTLVFDLSANCPSGKEDSVQNNLLISIDDSNFGIPLFDYSYVLDPTNGTAKPPFPVDEKEIEEIETSAYDNYADAYPSTVVGTGKPTIDIEGNYGSTFVNSKIMAYTDLIDRVKRVFGWPTIEVDLCDENIADFIDQAIEVYTKYSGYTEEFLVFDSKWYKPGVGIRMDKLFAMTPEMKNRNIEKEEQDWDYDLKNYRKILDVFSVTPGEQCGANSLFTFEYTLAQQTYYGFMGGSMSGFDLVTWNCVKNWLDCREKVLGLIPSFRFEPQTQYLRIYPEPQPYSRYYGIVSCYVTKPIKQLIMEPFIYEYVVALCSIAIGRIRSKYQFQLLGGATITGDQLLTSGLEKKKELDEQLWKGTGWVDGQPMFFSM